MDYTDRAKVAQALIGLYHRQTLEEQGAHVTLEDNGVGFNGVDAEFGTSVAQWLIAGKYFTDGQFHAVAKILPKYHRQIDNMNLDSIILLPGVLEQRPEKKPHPKTPGMLELDKAKRLVFTPNVYPSRQIMALGFSPLKTGAIWKWRSSHFTVDLVKQVQEMFGDIELSGEVKDLVAQMEQRSELPKVVADNEVLFPFQKESIQFLLSQDRAMLALAPGLGKTACSIFAANHTPAKHILIIAPLTLLIHWQREIQKWIGAKADIWHGNPKSWKVHSKDYRWVITNYETARKFKDTILKLPWELLIADESILIKNRRAERTAAVKEISKKVQTVWLLSGSPISRFYDDLWSQLNILYPNRFTSYWKWARKYCLIQDDYWGSKIIGNVDKAAQIAQRELQDCFFSRTQDQVIDLPDWIFEDIPVAMDPKQALIYETMEEEFMANLPSGDVLMAPNILAQMTRLIQIASNPYLITGEDDYGAKWKAVKEMMQWVGKPVIVWTNFIETAKRMRTYLGEDGLVTAVLTGATPSIDRQKIVDAFQAGQVDVLLAHPGVGKFGLTLTKAQTAIYLERSYNGDDYYQSLHRVRRIGTDHSPYIIHLLSVYPSGSPTIDQVISNILKYRKDQSIQLTTGVIRKAWSE